MKTVFFDVDTQIDFLFPAGALYVRGAEEIVDSLGELTRFAASNRIPIVSSADAHAENDPEFEIWKPHCIAGTAGQQKTAKTLLDKRIVLPSAPASFDRIAPAISTAPQIIIEKQALDCFTNPNLGPLLDQLAADRYVVYGVVTEHCVRCAAFGLLDSGVQVEVVSDAIKSLSAPEEKEVLDRFLAQGGRLTRTSAVLAGAVTS